MADPEDILPHRTEVEDGDTVIFTYESNRKEKEITRTASAYNYKTGGAKGNIRELFLDDEERFYKIFRLGKDVKVSSTTKDPSTTRTTRLGTVTNIEVQEE